MLKHLRNLVSQATAPEPEPPVTCIPEGQRVYAVGDVHGRLDLLRQMIVRIEQDDAMRDPAETTVIMLGDLVDRGADSAGVIAIAREWARRRRVRILMGNHEEMMLAGFAREEILRHFLRHGGKETLLSYGMKIEFYNRATLEDVRDAMPALIPEEDIAFVAAMEDSITIGDYLFVHAGIRPGIPLEHQHRTDLRWIRGEFIEDRSPRDFVVVHGHTITEEPVVLPMRIGHDTGAFFSGRLTAIGLEGSARWLLTATGPAFDPMP